MGDQHDMAMWEGRTLLGIVLRGSQNLDNIVRGGGPDHGR
jgi:hypothetical protein